MTHAALFTGRSGLDRDSFKLSVVIPVFNEEDSIVTVVESLLVELHEIEPSFEVILAQNGSTDRTAGLVDQLAAKHDRVHVINFPTPDYGHAMKEGFMASQGKVLTNLSVDLVDVGFIRTALKVLATCDVVLGSKYLVPGSDRRPTLRRLAGQTFRILVQRMFDLPVRDTHGIKAMRRDPVLDLVSQCHMRGALFDTELVIRAHRQGVGLKEIPVNVEESRPSRSGVARQTIKALLDLWRLRAILRREDEAVTSQQ